MPRSRLALPGMMIEGSNDGTNYHTLNDPQGNALDIAALKIEQILEVTRWLELGWPMWKLDERAGTQEGYYAHLLYQDTPSGRCGGWEALQWVIEALGPSGFDVEIRWNNAPPMLTAESMRRSVHSTAVFAKPGLQRKHLREISAKSRRASHLSPEKHSRIARKAARARWRELEKTRIKRWVRCEQIKSRP